MQEVDMNSMMVFQEQIALSTFNSYPSCLLHTYQHCLAHRESCL